MISYLSKRKLRVRYKGNISDEEELYAGTGQGCLLGMWCFLFLINFAGPDQEVKQLGRKITQPINSRTPINVMKKKWIDDLTILTAINLKDHTVVKDEYSMTRPLQYHERTEHLLPRDRNTLQTIVNNLQLYTDKHNMLINKEKTKVSLFNPLKNVDILPEISLDQGESYVDVVEQHKLLGHIISTDMKTISNTLYICQKAYKKMWMLRRLKELGCRVPELLDVLRQQILSILELAVPYWAPMITKKESEMIERILKTALHIILQSDYINFKHALRLTQMKSLSLHRKDIKFKCCKKAEFLRTGF